MSTLASYRALIEASDFSGGLPAAFRMDSASGGIEVHYAPFEHFNGDAKVALVGITPGRSQAVKALLAAQEGFRAGRSEDEVLRYAKQKASFGGDMREDLNTVLSSVGLIDELGLSSADALWKEGFDFLQCMSLLQFPVFKNDDNYRGSPRCSSRNLLFTRMLTDTAHNLNRLPASTLILPLGSAVGASLAHLQKKKLLTHALPLVDGEIVYLPHPSGQNKESVQLATQWTFETADAYAERRYAAYLIEEGKNAAQTKEEYCSARRSRHRAVANLRQYRGMPV